MKKTPKTPKKKALTKPDVFREFVQWISVFELLREPKTQGEFAKKFGVSPDTLSDWKKRDDFWAEVKKEWKKWGREKTSNVMGRFYKTIMEKGVTPDFKLWFQYFLDWKERQEFDVHAEDIKSLSEAIKKLAEK